MAPTIAEQQPPRNSIRLRLSSQRKRSQGEISIQMTSKASKKRKEQAQVPVTPLAQEAFAGISESDNSIVEELEKEGDNKVDDIEEEDIEEEDIEEEDIEEEETRLSFTSTWRAISGKETLFGSRSNIYTDGDITMLDLLSWKAEVLRQARPRQFDTTATKFEAIASYERGRASDECPQQIRTDSDLTQVMNVLKMWHRKWPKKSLSVRIILHLIEKQDEVPTSSQQVVQGRRTTTQQQLATLPHVLSTEQTTGNNMPSIADKWSCSNRSCPNFGFTCWQDRLPDAPDMPVNHFPVSGELMRLWGKEIATQHSTATQPSNHIVVKLVTWKLREKRKPEKGVSNHQEQGGNSATDQLLQALILQQLSYQTSQQSKQNHPTSSPLRTAKDPIEVLTEFFTWIRSRPSWKSVQQKELLDMIEGKVIEDGWDIERLKRIRKQDWQDYGFGIGTLERIRDEISSFKRQRPCSSSSSN